tara:strand:- start:1104 stop:2945 length:1842 start_codon:yes stop_codon:yes gene_type:complete
MSLYKRKILSFFLIFISILIASVLWDHIKFGVDEGKYKDFLFSNYISNNYNPINETIRYLVYITLPSLVYFCIFFKNENISIFQIKSIFLGNNYQAGNYDSSYKIIFCLIILLIFINFFSLKLPSQELDMLHEGMWLSAGQNYFSTKQFWGSSFITIGWMFEFGNPLITFLMFDKLSIGGSRYINLIWQLLTQILIILIYFKFLSKQNIKQSSKNNLLIIFSIFTLYAASYYDPLISFRNFPIFLFLIFLLFALEGNKYSKIFSFLIGILSVLSIIFGLDRGAYLNFIILSFFAYSYINKQWFNCYAVLLGIILGWLFFYFNFGKDEFNIFIENSLYIYKNMDLIHGIIHPSPFSDEPGSSRATKNLIVIIFSILITINFCFAKKNNFSRESKIFLIFFILISIISYKTALSRSDGPHLKAGAGLAIMYFFTVILFYFSNFLENKNYLKKFETFFSAFLPTLLFILFILFNLSFDKITQLKNFSQNLNEFVNKQDDYFLKKNDLKKVQQIQKLTVNEKCIQILGFDAAITYLLSKPSCNKFYFSWSIAGKKKETDYINLLKENNVNTIFVNAEDYYTNINFSKTLPNLINFIDKNYLSNSKIGNLKVYKLNKN